MDAHVRGLDERAWIPGGEIKDMKYQCTLFQMPTGNWLARHSGPRFGVVEVTADSREAARDKLQNELQYRVELCPCSGVSGETVVVQVSDG
jgi:hypothetical protein